MHTASGNGTLIVTRGGNMKSANHISRLSPRRDLIRRILTACLLLVCSSVYAADIHVPADYPTIAAAVAAARARTDSSTTILVAPGVYAESGILLDVPNLTLSGTNPLERGADGFPLDASMQPAVARVQKAVPSGAVMFRVSASNVRLTQLVLDGLVSPPVAPGVGGVAINVDGALAPSDGFSIDGSLIQGVNQGITTRRASGTIQGNRLTSMMSGCASFGGRPEDAKSIAFRDNLVLQNSNVGAAFQGGTGSGNAPRVAGGPGRLFVEVSGNEFRGNGSVGLNFPSVGVSFLVNDDSKSDATQPARLEVNVHDNLFAENLKWGFDVALRLASVDRLAAFDFEGTFERNRYQGNGFNAAIFAFRQVTTTLGGGTTTFRFGRGSTYIIHAENDSLGWTGFDLDHPALDPDPRSPGAPLGNTLLVNGSVIPAAGLPVFQRRTSFLRGAGADVNPPVLYLDAAPNASAPKYRDSAGVKFAGGNVFKEVGTWTSPMVAAFDATGALHTWIGLKNSDDQGTRFDLRAELYKNGILLAQGLIRCIQGVTRNPDSAEAVTVPFGLLPTTVLEGSDGLSLRILTRIGTNPDDTACGGHSNAVGLRLYFDSTNRPSSFALNP